MGDEQGATPETEVTSDATPEEGKVEPEPKAEETDADFGSDIGKEAEKGAEDAVLKTGEETVVADPVLGALAEAGIQHTFKSGKEFLTSYGDLRTKVSSMDQERAIGQQVMPHLTEFRQFQEDKRKQEAVEKEKTAWSPPPRPANYETQMGLEAEKRDPVFIEAMNNRARYLQEKWDAYTENPKAMFDDHFAGEVDTRIAAALNSMARDQELHEILDPQKGFIMQNYEAVKDLAQEMPLEHAVELVKLRALHGGTAAETASAAAKAKDVGELAAAKTAPLGVAKTTPAEDEAVDYRAVGQQALAEAKLTAD